MAPLHGNDQYLIVQLISEMAECQHRLTKILHFGPEEVQPGQSLTNMERFMGEFVDLEATIELCQRTGTIGGQVSRLGIEKKKVKIAEFIAYARSINALEH